METAIKRYQNRAIEAAAVIEELIALAQEMRAADRRGEALGLTVEEVAFYDALEVNDSAVKVLGDDTLREIAQELARAVRNNVTIDWTLRENVRAKMRVMVKRILSHSERATAPATPSPRRPATPAAPSAPCSRAATPGRAGRSAW